MLDLDPKATALALTPALCLAGFAAAQKSDGLPKPVAALQGSIVLAGGGKLPTGVLQAFTHLAGGDNAKLVLVGGRKDRVSEKAFRALGATAVQVVRITGKNQIGTKAVIVPLLEAKGVWIASDVQALRGSAVFEGLLRNVLARGGVVGGTGTGARALARFQATTGKRSSARGFDVFPRAVIDIGFTKKADDARLLSTLQHNPACVGWGIPKQSALVIAGRRICAIGKRTSACVPFMNT